MECKKIVKLSPAISSENIGDQIIDLYCNQIIDELFPNCMKVCIPTREHLSMIGARHVNNADYSFVCGTNILCSDLKHNHQWNVNKLDVVRLEYSACQKKDFLKPWIVQHNRVSSRVLLLGAGWFQYEGITDHYTTGIYRRFLSSVGIHSVRDSYTEQRLRKLGIKNVLNTSCPTMWNLTADHCRKIPVKKSKKVVTTLTNYHRKNDSDEFLLNILSSYYEEVYVWLQAIEDYKYLMSLKLLNNIHILPPTLEAFNKILKDPEIEYIGTRLHGGIHALNMCKRTLIIAMDNRALEISKDTGLPIIKRNELNDRLEYMITNDRKTKITLPNENIMKWKNQFSGNIEY
ncbi:MAG: polysaccharide pyruvyl transferase family protein [Lachnospiraceae bacterium]|nr:polysaccharide pyruvyl transferase family protein [Lachnospiraceae bacterium]